MEGERGGEVVVGRKLVNDGGRRREDKRREKLEGGHSRKGKGDRPTRHPTAEHNRACRRKPASEPPASQQYQPASAVAGPAGSISSSVARRSRGDTGQAEGPGLQCSGPSSEVQWC